MLNVVPARVITGNSSNILNKEAAVDCEEVGSVNVEMIVQ
jgi:hypothetical protein